MTKLSLKTNTLVVLALFLLANNGRASTFPLPAVSSDSLVGVVDKRTYVKAQKHETLLDIARKYDLGQNQIVRANKTVDRWMPSKSVEKRVSDKEGNRFIRLGAGKDIYIPNSYLLPNVPRKGLVLNLPEYRLYYYRSGQVITHPISIGRVDWNTPLGKTSIIAKTRNPTWTPPASIRKEHAEKGEILPAVFPAGVDNPLGLYAMRLGRAGYLIHSTNKPLGVGMRVSHGCIRMYPRDIERIFPSVAVGTPVMIINAPIKVGWSKDKLYIEVHLDLEDKQRSYQQRLEVALNLIEKAKGNQLINISGAVLKKALIDSDGIPVAIYKGAALLDDAPSLNLPATIVQPDEQIIPPVPVILPSTPNDTKRASTMPPPPRLNAPAMLPEETLPTPVVERRYRPTPPLIQQGNINNNNATAALKKAESVKTNVLLSTPPLRNNTKGNNDAVTIDQSPPKLMPKPPSLPKIKVLPKPPPPRLKEPEYSILKSAIPPK